MEPPRDVCSAPRSSPFTPMTAPQKTQLLNSWSLQTPQYSLVSSEMVMSLMGSHAAGPLVKSEQPTTEHAQNCGDDSALQGKPLNTAPITILNNIISTVIHYLPWHPIVVFKFINTLTHSHLTHPLIGGRPLSNGTIHFTIATKSTSAKVKLAIPNGMAYGIKQNCVFTPTALNQQPLNKMCWSSLMRSDASPA